MLITMLIIDVPFFAANALKLQTAIQREGRRLEAEARALNAGFIKRMESGLPFVRVKSAMSLDGRTAMASGESQWITGPAARAAASPRTGGSLGRYWPR